MRFRVVRVLAISAMAVLALIVVALLTLHTNAVQSRVLEWSVGELERRFDLNLTADDLHYNLASRRVVMTNVRLAAIGHQDDPFFSANSVTVQLPWAAYRGMLRFDEIILDTARVTITRDRNGVSNLPPGRQRDPNAPPRRIDARGLIVRNLDFSYRDIGRDIEIAVPGVRTDLAYETGEGASGPFAIDRDLLIRIRDQRVGIEPVHGRMVFDGSNVELVGVGLETTEGNFTMAGVIDRALDVPTLNLKFNGTADIARASRWTTTPIHVAGLATLEAIMTGAPSAFVLDSRVAVQNGEVGRERDVRVTAESRLTPNGIAVSRSTIAPATGGEVHATLDVPFGAQNPWWIEANWRGIDAAAAFRLAEVRVLPFGAALSGTARIDRAPGQPFKLEVHNHSTARQARGTAPLEGDVEFFVAGDRWRANQRHQLDATHVEGEIGGLWNRQAASQSTFDGKLTVRSGEVGEAARYAALFGFQSPSIVLNARGPLDADLTLDGTFTAPRFVGSARSAGVELPSIGTTTFTADFDASGRAVTVTAIDAAIGSSKLQGEVLADLVTRRLEGTLMLEAPSVSDLITAVPAALRLEGPMAANAVLGGTVDAPEISADVTGTGPLVLGGQPIDALTAKARVIGSTVHVDSLTLQQASGVLRATGSYAWNTRTYVVDVNGQGLTWQGTIARLGDTVARFGLKFSGAGTIDRPTGEGVVEFDVSGGGTAGDLIDRGVVNVRLNGDAALVTAHIPSLSAFVTSTVIPRQPFTYDAVLVMNRVDLAQIVTLTGLRPGHVTGIASLSATAKGALASIAESDVFVNLQDLEADVAGVPVRLASPSKLAWGTGGLTVDVLDVTVGGGRLVASGRLGEGGIDTARWGKHIQGRAWRPAEDWATVRRATRARR